MTFIKDELNEKQLSPRFNCFGPSIFKFLSFVHWQKAKESMASSTGDCIVNEEISLHMQNAEGLILLTYLGSAKEPAKSRLAKTISFFSLLIRIPFS